MRRSGSTVARAQAEREAAIRQLLALQEQSRANATKYTIRAWRYALLFLALLGLAMRLDWWPLLFLTSVAGVVAMMCWEKAGRERIAAGWDVREFVDEVDDTDDDPW